jgi:ATP-binding cassette subfamily F protein 2
VAKKAKEKKNFFLVFVFFLFETSSRGGVAVQVEENEHVENGDVAAPAAGDSAAAASTSMEDGSGNMADANPTGHFSAEFNVEDLSVTSVLLSQPDSRDIHLGSVTLLYCGQMLVENEQIELNYGNRYGLLGVNGCGKSTLMRALASGEFPIPKWVDIHLLSEEVQPSDMSALEAVIEETKREIERLEDLQMKLLEVNPDSPQLQYIDEKLEALDPNMLETRAGELLHGLGFTLTMQRKKTKDMSGGWRMRVALARALFVSPTVLLLDEPTNHLDLEAVVWLEEYLRHYPHILMLVSHSQDFLNSVCTHTIHWQNQKLIVYGGNYDTFIRTRTENETNQVKAYKKQQDEIAHMRKFIASAGTYANLVRQAKSREKIIEKMEAAGLYTMPLKDPAWNFEFSDCHKLPPPVLSFDRVSFGYNKNDILYSDVSFGVDCDSRIALVGKNGAGKSTLIKLMVGDLQPIDGQVSRHSHLKFGRYHQHLAEVLPMHMNVLGFVAQKYPEKKLDVEGWRKVVGRYGVTGVNQTKPMGHLSDGMRSRVVFLLLVLDSPNMLMLDEPTNHLDIACIDALADAIKAYKGGLVLVSHDFRLIEQVCHEIWYGHGTLLLLLLLFFVV